MAAALAGLGHEVELLGYGEPLMRRLLDGPKPDLVWNIAEGHGSGRCREARVPALLEMLDIPYTCSDPLTLATTLDKDCAKRLVAADGLATPNWVVYSGDWSAVGARSRPSAFPCSSSRSTKVRAKGSWTAASLTRRRDWKRSWSIFTKPISKGARRGVHRRRRADSRRHRQSHARDHRHHAQCCRELRRMDRSITA